MRSLRNKKGATIQIPEQHNWHGVMKHDMKTRILRLQLYKHPGNEDLNCRKEH